MSISGWTSRTGRISTWRAGQERHGAVEVDGEAALDAAEDDALDARRLGEFGFELVPGGFAAGAVARQHRFAVRILDAVDEHFDFVTDLQVGLLARRGEFAQRHAAFGLQADVDDGHVVFDAGDGALDDAAFKAVGVAEGLFEKFREIVARWSCGSAIKYTFLINVSGQPVVSGGLGQTRRDGRIPARHPGDRALS